MKFLADMGVSLLTVAALRVARHDATHLREEGLHRMADADIFAKAGREGRIVLTFDLDFSGIATQASTALPSVVIFRVHDARSGSVNPKLFRVIAEIGSVLETGAIVTVEDAGFRVRRLPLN